jgi:site-specific DNA-methyltransferase (adenine-specific)/modification methylase
MELNKIYNEDCLDTMARMPDNYVDIVFTSPPYNRKRNDKYNYYNDCIDDYFMFLKTVINECIRVSRGNVFLNVMKNYYNKSDVFKIIGEFSNSICEIFIWEKTNPLPAAGNAITNAYEFIFVFGDNIKSKKTYTKNHLTTSVAKMNKDHKAIMNPLVVEFFLSNFTDKNNIVYDPFMGSGTTAIVCKRMNLNFIGSEIIKEYVDLSYKNLKPYLSQKTLF